jgi:hypothetical protein
LKQAETVRVLLRAHGVQNLQNRVRATDGGLAPSEPVDPAAAPARDASAEAGPLPLDTVRLPPAQASATVEQPPPLPVVEDAELGDEDEEMGQQSGEDEEMGQQGDQAGEGEGRGEAAGLGPRPPKEDTEAWARRKAEQKKQQSARARQRERDNAADAGVARPSTDARRRRRDVGKRTRDEESNADAADVLVGLGLGS